MFRSSNDAGTTFNDMKKLNNPTEAKLQDVQTAAGVDNVVVTWWQINATSNEPAARISIDKGQSFESVANLASNGTINVISRACVRVLRSQPN